MAKETKVIEIRIDLFDAIERIGQLTQSIEENNSAISKLKKGDEDYQKQLGNLKTQIAAATTERRKLIASIVDEDKILKKRAAEIDKQVAAEQKRMSAEQKSANAAKIAAEKREGYLNQLVISVNELEKAYYRLSKAELEGTKGATILKNLKEQRAELQNAQAAYGKYSMNVGNYASATNMLAINLGQVMKEIPNFAISARIGIMSLTNNLPMLAEAFKAVRVQQKAMIAEGKAVPSMFSLITKSVFGLTGIMSIAMVLLQVFSEDISNFVTSLFKAKDSLDKATMSHELYNEALKDGNSLISDAKQEVLEVKSAFDLYNSGVLTADQALKVFNEKLGDNLGKQTDITTAMTVFNQLAPKYIEWSLKMAVAELAKEKAADATIKAIEAEKKSYNDYLAWYDKAAIWYNKIINGEVANYNFKKETAVKNTKEEKTAYENLYDTLIKEAESFAKEWGIITDFTENDEKDKYKKTRERLLSQFDYESKIMEERAKSMETGRQKELALIDADYNEKLNKGKEHIEKLERQEKQGVEGATEALKQARIDQANYELALEESKNRKKIEINTKYDKLLIENGLAELKHQYDMITAQNELSAKEDYDLSVDNAEKEYVIKQQLLLKENISDEEYSIRSQQLHNEMLLKKANAEKKYTQDLQAEYQKRLSNELEALTIGVDTQFQNIDEVYNKRLEILDNQKKEEIRKAGKNAELIKSIESKYAAESVDLENWKTTSKVDKAKFWADTVLNVGQEVNKAIGALAERELSIWAKANEGKANFDVEYEKKKIEIQRKAAVREKALAVFSTTIDTAAAIIKMLADPGGFAGVALSVAAGITGAAQIAAILSTPLPSVDSSVGGSANKIKTTVTEKFHSGGVAGSTPDSPQRSEEITRTLLTTERVLSPQQTSIFDSLVAKVSAMGGSNAIVSGAAQVTSDVDRMYVAMSKALRDMPAPIMTWQEFERQQDRQRRLKNNAIIK